MEIDKKLLEIYEKIKNKFENENIKIKITSSIRTSEQQNELYQQGRTKPGKIITNCDGYIKISKHQIGKAIDIVIIENEKYIWENKKYKEINEFVKKIGGKTGYNWEDPYHIYI